MDPPAGKRRSRRKAGTLRFAFGSAELRPFRNGPAILRRQRRSVRDGFSALTPRGVARGYGML